MMLILLIFVGVPLIELYLLLRLGDWIGGTWTFVLVVATGVIGAALARLQGLWVLRRARRELDEGKLPATSLVDGLMVLLAGALLITPGILTDLVGFSLLVPPLRALYRRVILARLRRRLHRDGFTIYSHYTVVDDPESPVGSEPPVQGYLRDDIHVSDGS